MSQPPPPVQTVSPIDAIQEQEQEQVQAPAEEQQLAVVNEAFQELPEQVEPVETITEPVEELPVEESPVEDSPEVSSESEQPVTTEIPAGPTRRIYGKITLDKTGEQLGGVNIMIPGSTVAKVSNPNGGYTIEVPENTSELIFIYRGKKLVQRISSGNSLMNVALDLESMQYD